MKRAGAMGRADLCERACIGYCGRSSRASARSLRNFIVMTASGTRTDALSLNYVSFSVLIGN